MVIAFTIGNCEQKAKQTLVSARGIDAGNRRRTHPTMMILSDATAADDRILDN